MIDGEGNLSMGTRVNANGAKYLDVKVRISGTNIKMMHEVGRIYKELNLTFFNSLMNKNHEKWKTGINVEVARQNSTKKLLLAVHPYLRGKADTAKVIIDTIDYVQSFRGAGNGVRRNYADTAEFLGLMEAYLAAHTWYFDPSTTTRTAKEPISLDGIV